LRPTLGSCHPVCPGGFVSPGAEGFAGGEPPRQIGCRDVGEPRQLVDVHDVARLGEHIAEFSFDVVELPGEHSPTLCEFADLLRHGGSLHTACGVGLLDAALDLF
jgi:hypothetical protein